MTTPTLPLLSLSDDELRVLTMLRSDLSSARFKLELLEQATRAMLSLKGG